MRYVPDWRKSIGVHRTNFENYEIFYIIDESKTIVYVIRILHSLTD